MNKEELTEKLEMVYLGDRDILNYLIGYYDGLKGVIELLKEENQELKKQLSNSYQIKNQQKEFIEYLEEPIRMIKQGNPINISEYTSAKLDTLEEVLLKYKEIIGDKDERI